MKYSLEINDESIKTFQNVLEIALKILKQELEESIFTKSNLGFNNPAFLTFSALNSSSESKQEDLFTQAKELEPLYSTSANYNLARLKINKNAVNTKKNDKDIHKILNQELAESMQKLSTINAEIFTPLKTFPSIEPNTPLYQQVDQISRAFDKMISHIKDRIEEVSELSTQPSKILALSKSSDKIESFFAQEGINSKIVATFRDFGFPEMLTIETYDAEIDWKKALKLFVIGALKIGIGYLLAHIPSFKVMAKDWVISGVKDVFSRYEDSIF